jgi:hypothetical protein
MKKRVNRVMYAWYRDMVLNAVRAKDLNEERRAYSAAKSNLTPRQMGQLNRAIEKLLKVHYE